MTLEQAITIGSLIVLMLAWTFSKRRSTLRLWLGFLLIGVALRIYTVDDALFGEVWRAVVGLPGAALDWLRAATA